MREVHPYGEFIPKKPRAMIIGSFPIGKFTNPERRKEIKTHEYDFFFGGEKNLLWRILGDVFHKKIQYREDIIEMLEEEGLAIGDLIRSCTRKKGSASDSDLQNIEWNQNLLNVIRKNKIRTVYFTSKKVETWFHKLFKESDDLIKISLISPSAQSLRSLGKREDFKAWVKKYPDEPKSNFILGHYRREFRSRG